MFAIYNNKGLGFRSTIDNLYNISNVDSISRTRNNIEEGLPKDHSLKNKKKLYDSENSTDSTNVYRQIANIDTKEQIFHIKDLMTNSVITLNEDNTLLEAYDLMIDKSIKHIPILNMQHGHIIGLLTQKIMLDLLANDLDYARNTMNKPLLNFNLGEVITTDPISDIRRVAKVLVDFSLSAIPVVDQNDKLKGIVSHSNILKALANTPPLQIWG